MNLCKFFVNVGEESRGTQSVRIVPETQMSAEEDAATDKSKKRRGRPKKITQDSGGNETSASEDGNFSKKIKTIRWHRPPPPPKDTGFVNFLQENCFDLQMWEIHLSSLIFKC